MSKKKKKNTPDWVEIKYAYVSSKKSLTDISTEFEISYSTLYKRATRENWSEQRRIFGEKIDKKILNRKSNAVARRYQEIDEAYGRIAGQLNDSVDENGNELHLYPVFDSEGHIKGFVELARANTDHAREVLKVLGQCKQQMDDLYGIVSREKEMDHEVAMLGVEKAAEGNDNGAVQVVISSEGADLGG